ncbi:DUF7344 domain-containing protein [Natrinema versiforme]|uniref:DUF7344 domain-containing protein n=1 Tax=Natrinema versiforme JCM 10478 TaxID=1227496 RepID=L9XW88_9EURY|nr:hypothetical protein [Natrinema versiforme]ELY65696.1 hypothetical protein C489_14040 [Natrinema versiforme JCM 10478]
MTRPPGRGEHSLTHTDEVFEALADGQRREVLVEVLESGRYDVPELTDGSQEIAEANRGFLREYLSTARECNAGDKERIKLHLVHIPALADERFIEWNRDDRVVTKGARFDELVPVLELLAELRTGRQATDAVITLGQ